MAQKRRSSKSRTRSTRRSQMITKEDVRHVEPDEEPKPKKTRKKAKTSPPRRRPRATKATPSPPPPPPWIDPADAPAPQKPASSPRTDSAKADPPKHTYVEAEIRSSVCPKCGSRRRSEYTHRREVEGTGRHQGRKFVKRIIRRTACLDCGQRRIDNEYIYVEG